MKNFLPDLNDLTAATLEFEKNLLLYAQIGGEIHVTQMLVLYLKSHGEIIGLDEWALNHYRNPWWVRHCAHQAAAKGIIKMERMTNMQGQPYKVTLQEKKDET